MIDFIRLRPLFMVLSLAVLIPCGVALAIWQLTPGIDFVGGLEIEVRFVQDISTEQVQEAITDIPGAEVQSTPAGTFLITTPVTEDEDPVTVAGDVGVAIDDALGTFEVEDSFTAPGLVEFEIWFAADATQDDVRDALETIGLGDARIQGTGESAFKVRVQEPDDRDIQTLRDDVVTALREDVGPLGVRQSASVSGVLSTEIARDAAIAVSVAAIAILIYITIVFRRLPKPLLYGAAAVVALLHDITIIVGVFAILGRTIEFEVNAMFVTAVLAVIGYSVNDTIVVFDRIRENLLEERGGFRESVNAAITQSLGRSLNTSITLIVALLALVLMGGATIRPFAVVLLIGAVVGTYSSIGVASQVVVLWEEGSIQRRLLFRRRVKATT